ncbi:MAG: cation-translocating P-type ATPase [Oscillospiraceae bacterium]|nr:cation-translocating P-type ATPase [Oscillospiraceae bacterium]
MLNSCPGGIRLKGLTSEQAEEYRKQYGTNSLVQVRPPGAVSIFFSQFKDAMVLILLAATGISALLGEWTDAVTIVVIVLLNAILGFIQEFRTEKTLEALRQMTAPSAKVWRDGNLQEIPAEQLVPGDLISIEAGDCIPADCLLITANRLYANESVLTGEAEPIAKFAGSVHDDLTGLHKPYLVYSGTAVTRGSGTAQVISTGKQTQMGQISGMLSEITRTETPLQKRLGELGKMLALICIGVCLAVFGAGVLRGEPVFDMLMTGISIAIAAIPEGLPATVTIALALAVNRMMKQKALVNRLHSVETLGCTSVICSDKTGTITENRMTVTKIRTLEQEFDVTGNALKMDGAILENNMHVNPKSVPALESLLTCAVLCNNAELSGDFASRNRGELSGQASFTAVGDPTETALLVMSAKGGITTKTLPEYTRLAEEPFDSDTRSMSVLVRKGSQSRIYTKGAVDVILKRCDFVRTKAGDVALTPGMQKKILEFSENLSEQALRVLAFAEKQNHTNNFNSNFDFQQTGGSMVFLGLTGMLDPPRPEAKEAIRTCASASVRTVMITGDHKKTAAAIARKAGLLRGGEVITGDELDLLTDTQLDQRLPKIAVFARVNPSHKLRLVRAFQRTGNIVTMTGDGVNDAPAIKEADVGVAMGMTGTDVAKQAADVILMDDNLATLVSAVEQGRAIYSNIRKFVRYLLSCNIGEVITMFLGILMGMPVVLLPVQLLLVNLATDGLPAIALGLEPPEKDIMKRPPRKPDESFFAGGLLSKITWRGIMIGLCTLGSFSTALRFGGTLTEARTCALFTLVVSQLIHVFECKSEHGTIFSVAYFSNWKLIFAVLFSALMLAITIWLPQAQAIFSTATIAGNLLYQAIAFSFAVPVMSSLFTSKPKKD